MTFNQHKSIPAIIKNLLINNNVDINEAFILNTKNVFNLSDSKGINVFVNLAKVNDIKRINKFHEEVNLLLPKHGVYISCGESALQRKNRKKIKNIIIINQFIIFFDFLFKRVAPKIPIAKQIYFTITQGRNRLMSRSEMVGRLASCGFEIIDIKEFEGLIYIFSKKIRLPYFDMAPSYGPIFKMKRVGKDGNIISVYKFRTMSPYSEYTQKKIIDDNKLDTSGKIKNDYRITFYGKFLRRYWIDEFPMIINWLKRDLKLVGVRPLSEDYFKRYPKDLQQLRIKTKPGLVPPYYVDLPVTFEEICQSERNYLNQYIKNPLKTDIIYFFKAFYNIIIKRKRSS